MAFLIQPLTFALMLAGGIYLHLVHADAQAILGEARRVEAQTQTELRKVQEGMGRLVLERQQFEDASNQRLQQIFDTESRIRNEALAAAAVARQAELFQRQNEEERQRLVLLQRQQEERLHHEALQRSQQAGRLAAAEARIQAAQEALIVSQQQAANRAKTVYWAPLPQPVVIQKHSHFYPQAPAVRSGGVVVRHCNRTLQHGAGARGHGCS